MVGYHRYHVLLPYSSSHSDGFDDDCYSYTYMPICFYVCLDSISYSTYLEDFKPNFAPRSLTMCLVVPQQHHEEM